MSFDPSTATLVDEAPSGGFDPSTAAPVQEDQPAGKGKAFVAGTASAVDLPLSMPGFILGAGAGLGSATVGAIAKPFTGESWKDIYSKAQKTGEEVSTPFMNPGQKLMAMFEGADAYAKAPVSQALEKFGELIKGGSDVLEKVTGIPSEGFQMTANTAFAAGVPTGAAWASKQVMKGAKAIGERMKGVPEVKPGEVSTPPEAGPTPKQEADFMRDMEAKKTDNVKEAAFKNKETDEILPQGDKHDAELKKDPKLEQGFLTASGNFLTRKEAETRAKLTGQLKPEDPRISPEEGLRSGDLWRKDEPIPVKDKAVPTLEETKSILKGAETVGDALGKLKEGGYGTAGQRILIGLLERSGLAKAAKLEWDDYIGHPTQSGAFTGGIYSPMDHSVTMASTHPENAGLQNPLRIFLHEATHAAASKLIDDLKNPHGIALNNLFMHVKISAEAQKYGGTVPKHYGLTDKHEFLSEAMSNGEFQRYLKSIELPENWQKGGSKGNAWDTFKTIVKEGIARLTGKPLDPKVHTAFDEAIDIGSHLVEHETTKVAGEGKPLGAEPIKSPISDPAVKDAYEKIDHRTIGNQKEFDAAAEMIYATRGREAALQFFKDFETYKETWNNPINEVDKLVQTNLNNKLAADRVIKNTTKDMIEAVPEVTSREAISDAVEKGNIASLTGEARRVAELYNERMTDIGKRAKETGTVKGLIENYVTHIVDWSGIPKDARAQFMEAMLGRKGSGAGGMSPDSRFGKHRSFETFDQLQRHLDEINTKLAKSGSPWSLKIKTKDIAEIYTTYAQSMEKAIENKKLVDTLKFVRDINGDTQLKQVSDPKDIPHGWKQVPGNQFPGYFANPTLEPALKFAFDQGPGDLMSALGTVSQVVKRTNVIGSLFHAKSLMEVLSSSKVPIWTPVKEVVLGGVDKAFGTKFSGITKAIDEFRKGGMGDNVDQWIKSDLMLSAPEDVVRGILAESGKFADSMIGKYGPKTTLVEKTLSTVEKYTINQLDKFTWDFLHTGGKLMVAESYLTKARMSAAEKGVPFDEVASRKEVASIVNKQFGGLNWFAEAKEAQSQLGKKMAMAAYSPTGRRGMQVVLFAPDWTISTLKAFTSALPESVNPAKWHPIEGTRGMMNPSTRADFARLYQMKTVLTYLTLINAINMMTANRPIWENKDPTRVEYPDGTSIQAMKHATEAYHWMTDPAKTLANKLGFLPKAAGVMLTGNEYLGPTAQKLVDPSATGRLKAVAKSALPFQVQAAASAPPGEEAKRAFMGTIGLPELGANPAQRKAARAEREKALKKAAKDYHKKAKEKGWE